MPTRERVARALARTGTAAVIDESSAELALDPGSGPLPRPFAAVRRDGARRGHHGRQREQAAVGWAADRLDPRAEPARARRWSRPGPPWTSGRRWSSSWRSRTCWSGSTGRWPTGARACAAAATPWPRCWPSTCPTGPCRPPGRAQPVVPAARRVQPGAGRGRGAGGRTAGAWGPVRGRRRARGPAAPALHPGRLGLPRRRAPPRQRRRRCPRRRARPARRPAAPDRLTVPRHGCSGRTSAPPSRKFRPHERPNDHLTGRSAGGGRHPRGRSGRTSAPATTSPEDRWRR